MAALLAGETALSRQRRFWARRLAGVATQASAWRELQASRAAVPAMATAEAGVAFDGRLGRRILEVSNGSPLLVCAALVAGLKACLFRYTGEPLVVVATPARRAADGTAPPNLVAVASRLEATMSFRDLLTGVRKGLLDGYAHQDCPWQEVAESLGPADQAAGTIYGLIVALADLHGALPEAPALAASTVLRLRIAGEAIAGTLRFDSSRHAAPWIARLLGHWRQLLESGLAAPATELSCLSLLAAAERRSLLELARGPVAPGGADDDVISRLAQRVSATPHAPALRMGGREQTYAELAAAAGRLAGYLRQLGVGAETLVAIALPRGMEMIAAVLAVLEAGGAFLPLADGDAPARIAGMLREAGVALVLSRAPLAAELPAWVRVVDLEREAAAIAGSSPPAPGRPAAAEQAAYVIYTSGSTGRPKGVVVTRGGLANLAAQWHRYGTAPGKRVLQFASPAFDSFVCEVMTTLLSGGTLQLEDRQTLTPGPELAARLRREGIHAVTMPPSMLMDLPDAELPGLELLIAAGEDCSADLADRWGRCRRFVNAYGPTEATVCATMGEHRPGAGKPPIGRPIANVVVYVVDAAGDLAPVGVAGEIWIGGAGVARGYLAQPGQTAARFVPDGFSPVPGARAYRTGDRGSWRADGALAYLGRTDSQLKLRGHRVEPGEIEAALRRLSGVRQAVVIAREDRPGDRRLVAYVVAGAPLADGWREALRGLLPDYLVPAAVVRLERLPLTPNGKLDRQALPPPHADTAAAEEDPRRRPTTQVEQVLAEIWGELLGCTRLRRDDHFFALGGHSLLVTQAVSRIRHAFGVDLPMRQHYESPVLADLARQIERRRGLPAAAAEPIAPEPSPGPWPLSYAQLQLWIVDQLEPGNPELNVAVMLRLTGDLEVAALAWSLGQIVSRHAILRTRYVDRQGEPAQVVDSGPPPPLAVEAVASEPELLRLAGEEAARAFDLQLAPPLRLRLLRLAADHHALLLTVHHIAADGWSLGILVRELGELYEARRQRREPRLAPLRLDYKDYACWQRRELRGERLEHGLAYWRRRLAGIPPPRRDGAASGGSGGEHRFQLSPELTRQLRELGRREGVTLFMCLLAGFAVLLRQTGGEDDLVVGTDSANRDRREVEDLAGFFVNQLVLRLDLGGNPTVRELLGRVRETALGAYAHQETPFERVVDELRPERLAGRHPLFQVKFVLQTAAMPELRLDGLQVVPVELERERARSKYDLAFHLFPRGGHLDGRVTYSRDRFDQGAIAVMTEEYERLLHRMAADAERDIHRLADTAPDAADTARASGSASHAGSMGHAVGAGLAGTLDGEGGDDAGPAAVAGPALRGGRRRSIFGGGLESLVTTLPPDPAQPLPAVLQPAQAEVLLDEWARASRGRIDELLRDRGAILFRGFPLPSPAAFERFADAASGGLFADYGDLPRESLGDKIYGSTPYPKEEAILFHNESSHLPQWPLRIFFHCVTAAASGGETPLLDCRRVYREMDPEVRDKFERLGLIYVRNFISGLDVGWQDFFKTAERQAVERQCRELGIDCSWTAGGDLRTVQRRPAVAVHPVTGDKLFFNQVQLHHPACLPARVRADLFALCGSVDRLPRNVAYGDGSPIEDEVIQELSRLYERLAAAFPWQAGDVVLLDNMAVAHGRRPYTGERKILVAMGGLTDGRAA